jgi:hypothetical protein
MTEPPGVELHHMNLFSDTVLIHGLPPTLMTLAPSPAPDEFSVPWRHFDSGEIVTTQYSIEA